METALDFIGRYTWGLVPHVAREPLWYILLGSFLLLLWFLFRSVPKIYPENIRGYSIGGPNRPMFQGFSADGEQVITKTPKEIADENAAALAWVIIAASFIFCTFMIKTMGKQVLEKEPVVEVRTEEVVVKIGQIATIANGPGYKPVAYTCTRTVQGPQFITTSRSGRFTGDTAVEKKSFSLASEKPTWWGTIKTFKEERVKYVCTN